MMAGPLSPEPDEELNHLRRMLPGLLPEETDRRRRRRTTEGNAFAAQSVLPQPPVNFWKELGFPLGMTMGGRGGMTLQPQKVGPLSPERFAEIDKIVLSPDQGGPQQAQGIFQTPLDLPGQIRGALQSGLGVSDRLLGAARASITQAQQPEKMTGGGQFLANLLNPVPGDTAQAAAMLATLPFKGSLVTGPLMRAAAAGVTGGAVKGIQGEDPLSTGMGYGGAQLLGELPFTAARGMLNQRALGKAQANMEATSGFNKSMTEALTGADKAAYEQAVALAKASGAAAKTGQQQAYQQALRAHAEQGASLAADYYKSKVPSWADIPSNERGLVDMVYGKGQKKLSDMFDAAMNTALAGAKGKMVQLRAQDAAALGIQIPEALMGADVNPINFPADQIINAMKGKSQSARIGYRRAAEALSEAGLGNEAARAEYKAGQELIDFTSRSGALKGGQFNPLAVLQGLTNKLPTVNALRYRGENDALRGPLAEATQNIPQKPGPLAPPTMPERPAPRIALPEPQLPEGFQTRTIPNTLARHPYAAAGALTGVPIGLAMGGGHVGSGAGIAFDAALLGALALGGKTMATKAPLTPLQEMLLRMGPILGGSALRGNFNEP